MLDYASLEALSTVVRTGSFDKAARQLHVTASAVSQRVKTLEERVGKVLVVRAQPCYATDAGEALCRHIERVALLEHELELAAPESSPVVRIAVNADSVATWLVAAIAPVAREHGVVFDVIIEDQDHTTDQLRRGAVQAAVTTTRSAVRGCDVTALGRLRFVAVCSRDFFAQWFAGGVSRESLSRTPCIVFDTKDRLQHRFMRRIAHAELTPPAHSIGSLHGLLTGCLSGMAWAMLPEPLVREHLARGRLRELVPGKSLDVSLYWQRFRMPSAIMDAVTQAMRDAFRAPSHKAR
jgi:LysR family transcriptional regulator (chromosome initiation inhibitor)